MDGKRGAQPAGSGDEVAAQGGASPERQTRRLSLDGAAGSVGARSRGQEPSEDTLQRLLPLLLERVEPEGAALLLDVCKEWRREMEARGFCSKTVQLCSALAGGGDFQSLGQIALRRLHASTGDAERTFYIEARAFLQRSCGGEGGLREWLQAASQEPDASFLSKGAASTAESLGLLLVQWAGKPQGGSPAEGCPLAGHGDDVTSVAVSPDGKRFASGSNDTLVKIWAADSGAEGRTLAGHTTEVSMVAFSSDGTRVFSGTREGVVKIWDTETGAEVLTLMGSQTTGVFKTNGTHVVCGSDSGLVRIWSAETGAQVCTVTTHGGEVTSVDISPDGKRVVSATEDGLVTIWDTETGAGVLTPGHKDFVISVAFSPDGKLVISGSFDGVVKIWDAATGAEVSCLCDCVQCGAVIRAFCVR
ncbi:quinon protein alcohol dehydrogenase-like superfamily [Baffinella frigidus]|nr:quinon protein alcohol dehydrogenase-like superfamily [Cryptophyta sp. CCMP2293]